jgi:subtilisin family serine protease
MLAAVLVVSLPLVAATGTSETLAADSPSHAEDHVMVQLDVERVSVDVLAAATKHAVPGWYEVSVPEGKSPEDVIDSLVSDPGVKAAELDPVVQLDPLERLAPLDHSPPIAVDDPHRDLQWHLTAIQAESAWAESTGLGVIVAVVDTGISTDGEDLSCQALVSPYNVLSGSTSAVDDHGHGTHLAGTIAQCTDNGVGVAGVAPHARLMSVKVLDSSGTGHLSDVASGIEWARAHGADVINLSLGCQGCQNTMVDEAIEAAVADGVVVVAAAGNSGAGSAMYPASHPDVIAVGAIDFRNVKAPYSNTGSQLDLVAPGGNTNRDDNSDSHPDGVLQETFCDADPASCPWSMSGSNGWGYYFFQGTSMAAPHVSGAVALLLEKSPGADPGAIRTALFETALDLGEPGFDTTYGHGLVQLHDALGFDLESPKWPDDVDLIVTRYGEDSLTLSWGAATDDVGVTGYLFRERGTSGFTTTGRQSTVGDLLPGAFYEFEVLARDEAGNLSEPLTTGARTPGSYVDTPRHTFFDDILWMSGRDITRGCNPPANDRFCPDDPVTRGQMAAFLVRGLGLVASSHRGFVDVAPSSTFVADIGRLATAGITLGCDPPENTRYCPGDLVTRGQLAAFLRRALSS